MCLISIAPKGTNKYSEEFKKAVKNGIESQNDGSGYAYWKKGSKYVYWKKGYLSKYMNRKFHYDDDERFSSMWTDLLALNLTEDDILIVHHRTSTQGYSNAENCHPFNLAVKPTSKITDINKPEGYTNTGVLFHNGHFKDFSSNYSGLNTAEHSDTALFTDALFCGKPEIFQLMKRDPSGFNSLFKEYIKTNKIAFLVPESVILINSSSFITTSNGYIHSNGSYKTSYTDYGGGGTAYPKQSKLDLKDDYYYNNEVDWESYYDEIGLGAEVSSSYGIIRNPKINETVKLEAVEHVVDETKASKFELVFEDDTDEVVTSSPFIEDNKTKINFDDYFDNIKIDKNVKIDFQQVKFQMAENWDKNQEELKKLLMLDNRHCIHLGFMAKEAIPDFGISKNEIVTCLNFDIREQFSTVNITLLTNKLRMKIYSTKKLMTEFYLIPINQNCDTYLSYLKLCNLNVKKDNFKYFENLLSQNKRPSDKQINLKKPTKIKLYKDGLKLFIDVKHPKTGLLYKTNAKPLVVDETNKSEDKILNWLV